MFPTPVIKFLGSPLHRTISNRWYGDRCKRAWNSIDSIPEDAPGRYWHRKCPCCGGEGSVPTRYSYEYGPEYDECPFCEGGGRVNQERWEAATEDMRREYDYTEPVDMYGPADEYNPRADHPEPRDLGLPPW